MEPVRRLPQSSGHVKAVAGFAATAVLVILLAPAGADEPCPQQYCGGCKTPWSELRTWDSCPDCGPYPCLEPGPPYMMCAEQSCDDITWLGSGFGCTQLCSPPVVRTCVPIGTQEVQCPCPHWWQCLIVE